MATGLAKQYESKGLTVMAFPCSQFGGQELGSDPEIKEFVETRFGLPKGLQLFSKINVKGSGASPIFEYLLSAFPGEITWNFAGQWLVGRDGQVLQRFPKRTSADKIEAAIKEALAAENKN